MTKEIFAQREIEKGCARQSEQDQIEQLYDTYLATGDRWALDDLLAVAAKTSRKRVTWILSQNPDFRLADVDDALQDGSLAVSQKIEKDRLTHERQSGFPYYVRTIYRNKALDFIKREYDKAQQNPVISLDDLNTDGEGKIREFLGQDVFGELEESKLELERQSVCGQYLYMYVNTLMSYGNDPQKPLALCFAKILYQLEALFKALEDPQTSSSITWAWSRMGEKNLLQLGMDSQCSVQTYLNKNLYWKKPFLTKLTEESPYNGVLWKDLVYTQVFSKKQTSNWVESIHKSVFLQTARKMQADKKLYESVMAIDSPVRHVFLRREKEKSK